MGKGKTNRDTWTSMYGDEIAEYILDQSGELQTHEVAEAIEAGLIPVERTLQRFADDELIEVVTTDIGRHNTVYALNGASREDYTGSIETSRDRAVRR